MACPFRALCDLKACAVSAPDYGSPVEVVVMAGDGKEHVGGCWRGKELLAHQSPALTTVLSSLTSSLHNQGSP